MKAGDRALYAGDTPVTVQSATDTPGVLIVSYDDPPGTSFAADIDELTPVDTALPAPDRGAGLREAVKSVIGNPDLPEEVYDTLDAALAADEPVLDVERLLANRTVEVGGHLMVHVAACPCPAQQAECARLASAAREETDGYLNPEPPDPEDTWMGNMASGAEHWD